KPFATSTTCRTYLQRRINKSAVALALGPLAKVSLPPKSARQSRCVRASRKVRAPQGRVPGNTWAARADGQCNRKQTADGPARGSGKGEMVRQERTARGDNAAWHGKPHPEQDRIGEP